MIATDLSKQKTLDVDRETIQQINFTGNLENNATIFFITEKAKKNYFKFFKRDCESITNVFHNLFCFNIISV